MDPRFLYLDTNIFVYLIEGKVRETAEKVANTMEEFAGKGGRLLTSALTITEFYGGNPKVPENALERVLGLDVIVIDEHIAMQAAKLQVKDQLSIGDAIHIATAMRVEGNTFFTNDTKLAAVAQRYMPVIALGT